MINVARQDSPPHYVVMKSIIKRLQLSSTQEIFFSKSIHLLLPAEYQPLLTVISLVCQVNKFSCNQMLRLHHLTLALRAVVLLHVLLIAPTELALQCTNSLFRLSYGTVDACRPKSRFRVMMAMRITAVVFKLNLVGILCMKALMIM